MALDGIAGVQARMAEIDARFGALAPPAVSEGATASGPEFAATLDAAMAETTAGATTPLATTAPAGSSAAWPAGLAPGSATAAILAGTPLAGTALPSLTGTTASSLASGAANVAAAAGAGPLTPAVRKASGGYGRVQPPADLVAYGNGKVPAAALAPLAGHDGHKLWAPASGAFTRMEADAAAAGVRIGITDSYRTYESQVDLAKRKGIYGQGGWAAVPGTSNHGWGLATDLDLDANALRWMRDNAAKYGFVEDVPREPWHWTYRPAA